MGGMAFLIGRHHSAMMLIIQDILPACRRRDGRSVRELQTQFFRQLWLE
jgi:hypothetical protein